MGKKEIFSLPFFFANRGHKCNVDLAKPESKSPDGNN